LNYTTNITQKGHKLLNIDSILWVNQF
jgi:hypothetical protein